MIYKYFLDYIIKFVDILFTYYYTIIFAIDVKSRRDKWRLILCPLFDQENEFNPCHIDEIAVSVRIVEIMEVSAHYE